MIDIYLAAHKLSDNRLKNFKVLVRCLHRFELYKKAEESRGFILSFANLTPEILRQLETFLLDEKAVFLHHPEIYEKYPYSAKVALKPRSENVRPCSTKTAKKYQKECPNRAD